MERGGLLRLTFGKTLTSQKRSVMAVMKVGHVRMVVFERRVLVPVRVRLAHGVLPHVSVLMMLIVHVTVVVFQGLVRV
jgi:hypothetical protein